MLYSADFETNKGKGFANVWAAGVCEIADGYKFSCFNSIEKFIDFMFSCESGSKFFFHNLKFDSEFIFYYLLKTLKYKVVNKQDEYIHEKEIYALINQQKQIYYIKICVSEKPRKYIYIYDSMKIYNMSVEDIAKGFGLPIQKEELDYNIYREPSIHIITQKEKKYIENDVKIVAMALKIFFDEGHKKLTIAANAMANYKEMIGGEKIFRRLFPKLDSKIDKILREGYRGGYVYVNPKYKNKILENGIVLDVNSLYPYVMKSRLLPYGNGEYYTGKYKEDKIYPLYIQYIRCSFKLKKGYIPTIQIKNNLSFQDNVYLESSNDEELILCLTSVDLKIFLEHYNTYNLIYIDGYKFKGKTGMFDKYIEYWSNKKIQAKKDNNKPLYLISKLFLNSLYGKYGSAIENITCFPYYDDEKDKIIYKPNARDERDGVYLPMAEFITAYAREVTITAAQSNIERYIYSDTDSVHFLGLDDPVNIKIDNYELGAFKKEFIWTKGKYIRQKCYIEEGHEPGKKENELKVTIAGMPYKIHKYVNFSNFNPKTIFTSENKEEHKKLIDKGYSVVIINDDDSKLRPVHVTGGINLEHVDFTIKI